MILFRYKQQNKILAFLHCVKAQILPPQLQIHSRVPVGFNTQYQTLPNIWVSTFPVRSVQLSWADFELILTVKMETRHPVEDQFGSEFLASYGGPKSQYLEIL